MHLGAPGRFRCIFSAISVKGKGKGDEKTQDCRSGRRTCRTAGCNCRARQGAQVVVFEKNKMTGRKLRITGKGRCNITNSGDIGEFISQYGRNGRFLHSAFSRFFNEDICGLLAEEGVAVKEERGSRIFPVSDRAADVADALERRACKAGAEIRTGIRVLELLSSPRQVGTGGGGGLPTVAAEKGEEAEKFPGRSPAPCQRP